MATFICGYSRGPYAGSLYVAQVKGDGGRCWGWTDDPKRAAPLTPGWVRRFKADARYLGWRGVFVTPTEGGDR